MDRRRAVVYVINVIPCLRGTSSGTETLGLKNSETEGTMGLKYPWDKKKAGIEEML
jgi:hypothetical protein